MIDGVALMTDGFGRSLAESGGVSEVEIEVETYTVEDD